MSGFDDLKMKKSIQEEMTKKGCHAEALEACALGIADYALAVMPGVKAFALTLRVTQDDTLRFSEYSFSTTSKSFKSVKSNKIIGEIIK